MTTLILQLCGTSRIVGVDFIHPDKKFKVIEGEV